ncbi:hypothetical protein CDEST_11106 [Colletotrichum destructivum]|uniref:Uncharacterized protein n=1 Tax=Colletotrichum destructivum TaxID=34406 RepID=A0AAX4ISC3_9PEZI|nr:hypothetical protein CDEST_11106 [Colletotrichum destructivum]
MFVCVCVCPYTQRPTMNDSKFPSGHHRHESPVPSSSFGRRYQTAHHRESEIPPMVLTEHTTVGCHPCQELACEAPCLTPSLLKTKPTSRVYTCPKLPGAMNQQSCVPRRSVRRSETARERERERERERGTTSSPVPMNFFSDLMLFAISTDDLP